MARNFRVNPRPVTTRQSGRATYIEGDIEFHSVNNSSTFESIRLELNPGLSSTFGTRTANIATGFEKYCFEKLEATYIPGQSVVTTPGTLYLAAEYDPNDDAPTSLQALSTYQTQRNGRVYEKVTLPFNVRQMFSGVQMKKVRCGPVSGDLTVHDGGSLIVAVDSGSGSSAIGKVWLHYRIRLESPQTSPTTYTPKDRVILNGSTLQTLTTAVPAPINFDEAISSGFTLTNDGTGIYSGPCGSFQILVNTEVSNNAAQATSVSLRLLKNGAALSPPQAVSANYVPSAANERHSYCCVFFVTLDAGDTFQISATAVGASGLLTIAADSSRLTLIAV
jgi:hypothetical protein